ncbi:hypothetical protein LCD52_05790 [Rossellomorea vietnamensis]|uniref:hypothetical protein n=1 Tax=Rossellomorea vietnamensis TaxID=218284 RepID=UPI001CCA0B38|nr:hypothetical protein [Rossellomorea vietnamensis]MCA0148303.1 hypothetical protein [Rossellomorea vietnamensis]MCC5802418.1 hypothetical protein [Rossellomorea vietnamensis]
MLSEQILKELLDFVEASGDLRVYDIHKEETILSDAVYANELEAFIEMHHSSSFSERLFQHIDERGLTDASVYKKAGVDRKLFSKIRSLPDYKPSKRTVVALCLSMKLSEEDTVEMLNAAGFSLSNNDRFDLVIQFCLEKEIHDMDEVNQALYSLGLKPL